MNMDNGTSKDKTTLVMTGELTIRQAGAARDELQDALKNTQCVELDVKAATEVDLAFLQLLCSAHRTSMNMNKTLMFKGTIPTVLKKSIEDNGYARTSGCVLNSNYTCLWQMKRGEDE